MKNRGGWLALALLLAGLGITRFAGRQVAAVVDADAKLEFDHVCEGIQVKIEERIHDHEQILRSGAAFFSDTDGVERDEWHDFAERQKVSQTLPGIQGIGFAMLVPREQLPDHLLKVRAEGFPEYKIWPEGEREVYSTIIFLEPFDAMNRRAFGYDMLTEAVRRAAMEKARDQDLVSLSGKVTLVQEADRDVQAGTLMYAPVYRMGAPRQSVAERRAAIIGWVYSPYRMNDLMAGILDRLIQEKRWQIHLTIFDSQQASPESLLYDSQRGADSPPPSPSPMARRMIVDAGGRSWLMDFTQAGDLQSATNYRKVIWVWAGGTVTSLLVAGLALSLINTRHNGRKMAERLTADLRQSEERWQFALEGAGDGVWDWNVQTGDLLLSNRWKEQLGHATHEIGSGVEEWSQRVHPEDLPRAMADLEAHFAGRSATYINEQRLRCKDGSWKWILDRGLVVRRDATGQPLRMIGTHKDISARKQTEAELARLSVIEHELTHLAANFINVSLDQQDAAINQSLATMGGLIRADSVQFFSYDFDRGIVSATHEWCGPGIQPETAKLQEISMSDFPDWVEQHRRGEPVHIPSVAALPPDHEARPILDSLAIRSLVTMPLMHDGECLGFVAFNAILEERRWKHGDIALLRVLAELYANFEVRRAADRETRALQQRLIVARDEAQAAANAKSLFLANMSHEIRTPLNAILGYAQIMEHESSNCSNGSNCPNRDWLKAITRSGEHLLSLVTDLLELVRSDVRTIHPVARDFDFHQMLEDVRLMFALAPEALGLTLAVRHAPEVPRFLRSDPVKVRQILANLLGNALKFTHQGGVVLTTSLLAGGTPEDFVVAVDVEDTGCGISDDDRERIFEVFEQAEHGRNTGKGAGLGLPLSRRYARALGGDVTVASKPDAGCRFHFTFRAMLACDTDLSPLEDDRRGPPAAQPGALPIPLPEAPERAANHPAMLLDPAALEHLPAEQLHQLRLALRRGDVSLMRELVAAIATDHASLAAVLRRLLDAYDYGRLADLLDPAPAAGAASADG